VAEAIVGLSEIQVEALRQSGKGNEVEFSTSRTYLQILRQNAFTFINSVLFGLCILLALLGQVSDALLTASLVLVNVLVGVFQEARAKRQLDHIALLNRPQAAVVREGVERDVDPAEIVVGDVLVARPGDQIVVDGELVGDREMEVDESLLTGESERVRKRPGDPVYSGSFCVAGSALYRAEKVGAESLAARMTASARAFRQVKTPLQHDIDYIIRVLVLLVAQLGILLGLSYVIQRAPLVEGVRVAAVLVALVPQGLYFMTTAAYAIGGVRVARQGALIQQANAVESISNINMLCLDKTGTLTTNRVVLGVLLPANGVDGGEEALREWLGRYVASIEVGDETTAAIAAACPGEAIQPVAYVPFSSERKWGAVAFSDPSLQGVYVLGAPETLRPALSHDGGLAAEANRWSTKGLRVLLFARHANADAIRAEGDDPSLPSELVPLGLVGLRHELRDRVSETLRHFAELGVEIKVISGDDPRTVAAILSQAGYQGEITALSGTELEQLDADRLAAAVGRTTVFGRVSPQQKRQLVQILQERGGYVAMIGDGVNDVLSLKEADVAIAMRSGSSAARHVADLVLLRDSFSVLPAALREGQRIVKGMEDVARLLLTRTVYVGLLVIATQIVGVAFPVTPKHNAVLALLTVGIPIIGIAAWARPGPPPRSIVRSTGHFVFPAGFTVAILSLAVYLLYLEWHGNVMVARTALTTAGIFCGLILIAYVEPPTRMWVGGDVFSGDWRPSALAGALLLLYGMIMALPAGRGFFELVPLRATDYLLIGALVIVWALLLRLIWRTRLPERLLSRPTR
jgi:cation-transporting ATPase E